ncbi:MAG: FG-GAP repeat protein, partial [Flavobacteriales bacterium]|nr:FG-GAP repeat protein [Flavobacteriales bacterium]
APFHTQSLSEQGLARVFLGSPSGLSTVASWTAVGGIAGAHFGYSVASAGDVNGDGYADVLVGVPDEPSTGEGRVHVFHGGPSGLSTTPAVVMLDFANGSFGESVATAGDVNGDGYSDVVIGEGNANMMHFFYGSASGLTATTNFLAFQGGSPNDYGSSDISGPGAISAGDVNGDGYSDVIVGARLFAWPLTDEGMARCFHGSASTPLNSWTRYGGVAGGWFGVSVSSAGDVDGDGYSDVIVGGCQTNGGGRYAIYAGSQGGLGASPSTNFTVIGSGIELGHSVCSLGDVNGDGYGDVAVSRYADGTGKVDVLLGNWNGSLGASGSNRRHNLRLYNTDLTTPISAANIPIPQFGAGLFTRPFLGRGKTRMVWETRIQGQPFSTAGGRLDRSVAYTAQQGALTAGAVAGVELKQLIDKPIGTTAITATKVRTRVRYDPVTAITGQVFGPWRYMPGYQNGTGTHNNVPLPVELLYFEAVCEGSRVALEWATGSEQESDHFIVERSMVTDQWQSIATIDAAGHSQATITYRFVDDAPPQSAVSYYRLIQVDQDGSTNVLRTIAAPQCASTVELTVFPNPTGDRMSVLLPRGAETDGAWLELRDATGRTLVQWKATGAENSMDLDLGSIQPGWYHLELNDGSGRMLGSAPVIKQ